MIVGVTGHRVLPPESLAWVARVLDGTLADASVGVSCLAPGADSLFAQAVLVRGIPLVVVLPFADYATELDDRREFDGLVARAQQVATLERVGTKEDAYLNAGRHLVDRVERLVAVWNGLPAVGVGGTGDVVEYARGIGRSVVHIDPTAQRIVIL